MDPPRRLADLKAGVRLVEVATGTIWEVEGVRRANTYATPWVHLIAREPADAAGARRVEGAGTLIAEPPADPFAPELPAWTVHAE